MFTGIVEQIGTVAQLTESPNGKRFTITGEGLEELAVGASLAVNGVCLTAVEIHPGQIDVDVVPETLERTNLGSLEAQSAVNLERPVQANGRLDGHIVQGHVDGVGQIIAIDDYDGAVTMTVSVDDTLDRYLVEKGSIAIDGVSLTVASAGECEFTVALIPHTLEVTTLGLRKPGDQVNLEVDVLAKYVERLLDRS